MIWGLEVTGLDLGSRGRFQGSRLGLKDTRKNSPTTALKCRVVSLATEWNRRHLAILPSCGISRERPPSDVCFLFFTIQITESLHLNA